MYIFSSLVLKCCKTKYMCLAKMVLLFNCVIYVRAKSRGSNCYSEGDGTKAWTEPEPNNRQATNLS